MSRVGACCDYTTGPVHVGTPQIDAGKTMAATPPAFQFYAADFLIGATGFTLEELGAYIKLLALSWDKGAVPFEPNRRAIWLGIDEEKSEKLWEIVGKKWKKTEEGYIHERLEFQRRESKAFRRKQIQNGKLGGVAKALGVATLKPKASVGGSQNLATLGPKASPPSSSPISDLRSKDKEQEQGKGQGQERSTHARASSNPHHNPSNLINGSEQRRHGSHAWCSWPSRDGLCVPRFLHSEFIGKLGRPAAEADLMAWYPAVVARFENVSVGDDALRFWRNEFGPWAGIVTAESAPRRRKPHEEPGYIDPTEESMDRIQALMEGSRGRR